MRIIDNNDDLTEDLYLSGKESVFKGLEYAKNMQSIEYDKLNFFAYWIGYDISYKHSVVIKSFIATQNMDKCDLYIYSDVDLSESDYIKPYLMYNNIHFKIFDVIEEVKGTILEHHSHNNLIKNHSLNPALESDYFRLLMLHKFGGIYIDFDVLLLRDFSPLLEKEFMYQWQNYPVYNWINGAIMYIKKDSLLSINLLKDMMSTKPSLNSLCWASDLYCRVREYYCDWLVYPGSFFNSEWQCNIPVNPFGIYELTNEMFDGAFSWHWHNKWNQVIAPNSKFDQLDKKFDKKIKEML